ncbi:MAG: hypothetical protein V9G12_25770 [Microthrixaceae bacterium]
METSRPARIDTPPGRRASLRAVLLDLVRHPRRELVSAWNYKTAVASAVLRGSLFFAMTISAGLDAALGVVLGMVAGDTQCERSREADPDQNDHAIRTDAVGK